MTPFTISDRRVADGQIMSVTWMLFRTQDGYFMRREGQVIFPEGERPGESMTDAEIATILNGMEWPGAARPAFDADFDRCLSEGTLDLIPAPPEPPTPPTPPSVPTSPPFLGFITFRQLILALLQMGAITSEQALAAAETRARPPQFEAIIDSLSPEDALVARITWATMTNVYRNDPLFAALIAAGSATAAQIDDLFALARTL